ncbi:hypothetical protein BDY19DRAFT_480116 [Irpex rosettiformis]|uniref:Uncharacterized protein n=1 Tax=Irpex rosettiformis TaxID=378272 RepID=A0ACB8TSM8_9APHY|nr:hypothetical protein BDY19DRAFT_480116 [Irpex rosettiformis]
MAAAAVLSPRDVQTTFNYFAPIDDEPPFQYTYQAPLGQRQNNIGQDRKPAVVHDVRGKEQEYGIGLDTSGFQFVKHESAEKDFTDEERITTAYYKEVEELLKKEVGAKRVFIFDHTIRRKPAENAPIDAQYRGPVERVHIDQTYEASVKRVYRHLGDDAERLLKGRVRIINVWRPIKNPVAHKPLAVSDWRHLDQKDLVVSRLIYPDREGGVYQVKHNPEHRWYYLSDQKPDEVTLIKCYDSDDTKARLTPHSAFLDSTSSPEAPHRESIEIRTLVFDTE